MEEKRGSGRGEGSSKNRVGGKLVLAMLMLPHSPQDASATKRAGASTKAPAASEAPASQLCMYM